MMSRIARQVLPLHLAVLILAWPLLCFSQGRSAQENVSQDVEESAQTSESESSSTDFIYQTLIFDTPVPLRSEADGLLEPEHDQATPRRAAQRARQAPLPNLQNLQQTISEIESEGGPWELNLAENLASLAEVYEQQGAYEEAIDTYTRAMHISRVNLGLNSLNHIPLAERLVNAHLALGDWEGADQYQEYLYYNQRRAYGEDDPRLVPVLHRLANWKLSSFNAGYGDQIALNLVSALRLYQAASNIVSINFGNRDERYVKYLRDTAGTAFLVSRYRGLIESTPMTEFRVIQERYPGSYRAHNAAFVEGYEEGLDALERVVAAYSEEQAGSIEHVTALIHLADWYLLFDRHRSAHEAYSEAYAALVGQENRDELLTAVFGSVKPLPDFSDEIDSIFVEANVKGRELVARASGHVDVEFDVTPYGTVVDLQVLAEGDEVDARILSSLRRLVRSTTFRPVVQDGQPVRSESNRFRYRYVY
jgi:tetratricopeptide (TPR) repeat protein